MPVREWLPPPPKGTAICLGFDGSDFSDFTGLRAETLDGYQFTPRYGHDQLPTIWNPSEELDARTPRDQVTEAVDWVMEYYDVARAYCDPPRFETDIDTWSLAHPGKVFEWETNRPRQMFAALERFSADLAGGRITQDGCPTTELHMDNARRVTRQGRYLLGKPSEHQKIDLAMASVLAHEASCDARAAGWTATPKRHKLVHFKR